MLAKSVGFIFRETAAANRDPCHRTSRTSSERGRGRQNRRRMASASAAVTKRDRSPACRLLRAVTYARATGAVGLITRAFPPTVAANLFRRSKGLLGRTRDGLRRGIKNDTLDYSANRIIVWRPCDEKRRLYCRRSPSGQWSVVPSSTAGGARTRCPSGRATRATLRRS